MQNFAVCSEPMVSVGVTDQCNSKPREVEANFDIKHSFFVSRIGVRNHTPTGSIGGPFNYSERILKEFEKYRS